ncbi:hypothetical protein C1646_768106 [Rhizophagus diaphanus]|nr:hypothetical protein C1646_768106 [Rhizophagus diaphanus] [Rhizophagus sp. MUCL 43196]
MDLSIYYNEVIFPVNAAKEDDISLATYLSGGNYDGDKSSEFGIFDKQSIYLTQMSAQLIDATKRGLTIKPNVQQYDN